MSYTNNKKIMRVLALFLILSSSYEGQAADQESTYGFLAGMSTFNQKLQDGVGDTIDTDSSNALGAYVGVYGEKRLTSSMVIVPGIYFSQKGVKGLSQGVTLTTKADYLETSASLRWYFTDNGDTKAYLGSGLGFGILLGGETVSSTGAVASSTSLLARNELSFQGGAGLELKFNEDTGLTFGITYCRGLSNNLNVSSSQGNQGTWNGFYGFAGIRFKSKSESTTPIERARDYLRMKNKEVSENTEEAIEPKKASALQEAIESNDEDWKNEEALEGLSNARTPSQEEDTAWEEPAQEKNQEAPEW